MTWFDWFLVVAINGVIIAFGFAKAKGTLRSLDWFLASRGLPWWIVGLSMFATAVDSGDYVAIAGAAYKYGITNITEWWLGMTLGWLLVAYLVFMPMYRTGMYTNAEYLEYRFGPAARALSVFIQIQYRTNVLANVAYSLYLTFSVVTGWGFATWWLVGFIALAAAAYTASGGLKSVAVTDAMQSVAMLAAALVLWLTLWNVVGGWSGLELRLDEAEKGLAQRLLHVGGYSEPGAPAGLVVVGWIIVLSAYCVVNHSQAMRMLAARSEWDMKMAAVAAGLVTAVVLWFNVTIGLLGKAIFPDLPDVDQVFPKLVNEYLGPGLLGIVVAGLLAGGISTYDSISSALSAVFTRDLYARFLVKDRDDRHYLFVSRLVTFVVIAVSFVYVPLIQGEGMVAFYLALTPVAVIPLFAVYLMGTLTRVNRVSGTVGLVTGMVCGLGLFAGDRLGWDLPIWLTSVWWRYLWGIALPALAMVGTSVLFGWASREEIEGLFQTAGRGPAPPGPSPHPLPARATGSNWLDTTHAEVPKMPRYPFAVPATGLPWHKRPHLWAVLLVAALAYLNLWVLW